MYIVYYYSLIATASTSLGCAYPAVAAAQLTAPSVFYYA